MKKLFLILLPVLFLFSCQDDLAELPGDNSQTPSYFSFSENDVVKGRMRIKLSEEPTDKVQVRSTGNAVQTGISVLDRSAATYGITRMERTFPYAGKFEERTRKEGLHLWYDVWFSEDVATTRAVGEISMLDGIQTATPVLKVVSTASEPDPVYKTTIKNLTRNADLPFNDEYLSWQWSYYNPGNQPWQVAGADIRLSEVWEQYNGHPDIIIAIVDGGIALNNPDLQANLWVNTKETDGNGIDDDDNGYVDDIYGYNFVSETSTITPHRHGSHVAGTVAGTNNNGIGICGIAGGDGSPNSGVKLMSCQIFEHISLENGDYRDVVSENIPAAIKYGADNGAVISQNSWGYAADTRAGNSGSRSSYIDPAHKEAIDYFVKYAGCDNNGNQLPESPMKGGIVLFAAGNNNSSNPRVAAPADYEKVLGIAAISPDYKKAAYSNFGDYIDLCAPGGNSSGFQRIYSTTIQQLGFYEFRYGTSMACPHVAGVAALVIEKYGVGKPGFTARQLEEILLTTAYDVDKYNVHKDEKGETISYAGKLGSGCVNAAAALQSELPQPEAFDLKENTINDGVFSFRVNMEMAGTAQLKIYNSIGNRVMDKEITATRYVTNYVDISELAAGYYNYEYITEYNLVKGKFVKY